MRKWVRDWERKHGDLAYIDPRNNKRVTFKQLDAKKLRIKKAEKVVRRMLGNEV